MSHLSKVLENTASGLLNHWWIKASNEKKYMRNKVMIINRKYEWRSIYVIGASGAARKTSVLAGVRQWLIYWSIRAVAQPNWCPILRFVGDWQSGRKSHNNLSEAEFQRRQQAWVSFSLDGKPTDALRHWKEIDRLLARKETRTSSSMDQENTYRRHGDLWQRFKSRPVLIKGRDRLYAPSRL